MTWLNAALAFAITMLILSMVTSVFVETIHRLLGLRERGLYLMLGQYYDRVVSPYLSGRGVDPAEFKTAFLDVMTLNRAPAGAVGSSGVDDKEMWDMSKHDSAKFDKSLMSRLWSGRRLARLSADEFMSRLGGSDTGAVVKEAIDASGIADPAAALQDMVSRFEAFGREACVFFERRARLTSIIIAVVVAWLMYVHPYDLFKAYMGNEAVTNAVIDMQKTVLAQFEETQKPAIAGAASNLTAAEKASRDAAAASEADPGNEALKQQAADAEAAASEARITFESAMAVAGQATRSLQQAGVPIGWNAERMTAAGFATPALGVPLPVSSHGLLTAMWLVIGGLLVGLGGPFWYDMVKSLTSIRTLMGGAKSLTNTGEGGEASADVPRTAVDHFMMAIAGREAATMTGNADDEAPVG